MADVRKGTANFIPKTCGECEYIRPYLVPLPQGPGIPPGAKVKRYHCGFDHHSAVDSKGRPTAVNPSQTPPINWITEESFCPLARGWKKTHAKSSTHVERSNASPKKYDPGAFEAFPIDEDGFIRVRSLWFVNNAKSCEEHAKRGHSLRIVSDGGTVFREMLPPKND